jgi:hypothetical protein
MGKLSLHRFFIVTCWQEIHGEVCDRREELCLANTVVASGTFHSFRYPRRNGEAIFSCKWNDKMP